MANHHYSIDDLMRLRAQRAPGSILPQNPEIAEILRHGDEFPRGACNPKPASSAKIRGDSSESSDEILFKGNKDRRASREAARELAIRQAAPRPAPVNDVVPTRELIHEPNRNVAQDSLQNPTGWKYRGRSESELGSSEPLQAPTGVPSQKQEGFQRFFKAVISPTHVRVTAGGRIVPNTRGPSSPSRRTKDTSAMDAPAVRDQPQPNPPAGPMGISQPLAVWPQLIPGYPNIPMSMIPMQFSPQFTPGYSFPSILSQPMVAQPSVLQPSVPQPVAGTNQSATDSVSSDAAKPSSGETHGENAPATNSQDAVKITSPENFDRTKPFYFNGQLVYPLAPGFAGSVGNQMMPIQMVGLPAGVSHTATPGMTPQFSAPVMQVSPHGAGHFVAAPLPSAHTFTGIPAAQNRVVPVNGVLHSGSAPPPSSIKMSEVTKKQIGVLKNSIKWCEDQLQYNRFQIDENNMRDQLQKLEAERQLFEARYQAELAEEEAAARNAEASTKGGQVENKSSQGTAMPPVEPQSILHSTQELPSARTVKGNLSASIQPAKAPKGDLANKKWVPVFDDKNRAVSEGAMDSRKPGLPVSAAKAPVFLPRAITSEMTERSQESREAAKEYFGAHQRHESGESSNGKLGVPYLLGRLRNGVNPRTATDQDYVYFRELTPDEVRARYLYWGKAPKSCMQGLPKYDGKHFYPPSPIKESSAVSDDGESAYRPTTSRRPIKYDFRGTKSDCDPFRPITPTQSYESSKAMFASEDGYATGRHARTTSVETEIYDPTQDKPNGYPAENSATSSTTGVQTSSEAGNAPASDSTGEKRAENWALWPMLKKSATSSAVSSTTAQGYLPQYAGHAAASLSPSMGKNMTSPVREVSSGKPFNIADGIDGIPPHLSPGSETRGGENLPPNAVSAVEERMKHMPLEGCKHNDVSPTFHR
ncbi:hypothetical protein V8F20_007742 [Naviculisporaceae sp. PSN 640]